MTTNKRCIDLFSGCGGMSLGFALAGYEVVAAFDNWEPANATYTGNLAHTVNRTDLSNVAAAVSEVSQHKADIIIGGPPCQDFSPAGNRIAGDKATLTICYAEIIAATLPSWFVMENVERATISVQHREAVRILSAAGYSLETTVLDASLYNVPQKRKRAFTIGSLHAQACNVLAGITNSASSTPLSVRDHFRSIGLPLDTDHYYCHPRSYQRRGVFSVDEPSPTVRGVNRPIPPGYRTHAGDTADASLARPLTAKERAAIQTFPPEFAFVGTQTQVNQMIGNAVPVNLARAVAEEIARHI